MVSPFSCLAKLRKRERERERERNTSLLENLFLRNYPSHCPLSSLFQEKKTKKHLQSPVL
jgi:hypothetical protein